MRRKQEDKHSREKRKKWKWLIFQHNLNYTIGAEWCIIRKCSFIENLKRIHGNRKSRYQHDSHFGETE